jgi:hypothetical protein
MTFLNIANVHTIGVGILHILEVMGVEARIYRYIQFVHTFNNEEKNGT